MARPGNSIMLGAKTCKKYNVVMILTCAREHSFGRTDKVICRGFFVPINLVTLIKIAEQMKGMSVLEKYDYVFSENGLGKRQSFS